MPAEKNSYVFSQKPVPVSDRKKFREPILDFSRSNIMADPRVVRGNTYAALVRPDSEESSDQKQSSISKRFRARAVKKQNQQQQSHAQSGTFPQGGGQRVPTHELLEVLRGPVAAHTAIDPDDMEQGDEDTVPFVPKPAGHNKETRIDESDLFDFEISVEAILEVIVGKSLEQGMIEILSEEENRVLSTKKSTWEQQRDSIHVEAQILLSEKKRQDEEYKRRIDQATDKALNDKVASRRWGARDAAKTYLDEAKDSVLERLQVAGHFYDPVVNQINTSFMPWLLDKVSTHLTDVSKHRQSVERVIERAVAALVETQIEKAKQVAAAKAAEEKRLLAEAAEKKRMEDELKKKAEEDRLAKEAALAKALADEADEGDQEKGDEEEEEDD